MGQRQSIQPFASLHSLHDVQLNMGWCQIWRCRGRSDSPATLRPAVLGKFETRLVQTLFLLILIPFGSVIMLFTGFHDVFCRWKEHAPPLWKVHQCYRKGASYYHDPHPWQTWCCREGRAWEKHQLCQPRPKVPSCTSQAWNYTQRSSRNERDDAKSCATCCLSSDGEENHRQDSNRKCICTAKPDTKYSSECLEYPKGP